MPALATNNHQIWAAWLEEWSDECLANGSNFHYTLTKARRSLLQHPFPLSHPDELRPLKFFGDRIIGMIAKRYKQENDGKRTGKFSRALLAPRIPRLILPLTGSSSAPSQRPSRRASGADAAVAARTNSRSREVPDHILNDPRLHGLPFSSASPSPADPGFLSAETAPPSSSFKGSELRFSYCDENETPISHQSRAFVEIQGEALFFAVLFRASQLSTARTNGLVRIQPSKADKYKDFAETFSGLLPETSPLATETSPGLLPVQSHYKGTDPTRRSLAHITHDKPSVIATTAITSTGPGQRNTTNSTNTAASSGSSTRGPTYSGLQTRPLQISTGASGRLSSQPLNVAPAIDFSLITWPAGTYEILCLVDTREMKDAKSRDFIAEELRMKGVNVERRSLELGDVAWVAKRKGTYNQTPTEVNTVVLDFIVERKRLDDLVSSLTDGRFHEQKCRLKRSGISNVFFVIETSKKDHVEYVRRFDEQINTAVSSTQIINEFFVHRTKDIKSTVELLRILHEGVCQKHRDQALYIIPPRKIHRETHDQLQRVLLERYPLKNIVTSYESFSLLSAKSTFQTAKECFAKQLLCIRGMSPERVAAVVERYGTLRSLWESFRHAIIEEATQLAAESGAAASISNRGRANPAQRAGGKKKKTQVVKAELMLAELGHGRRRIGPELSKRVFHLFVDVVYD